MLVMVSNDIKSRFGTAVRTQRKRLGISQEELAGRAGLHRVGLWVSGAKVQRTVAPDCA